MAAGTAGGTQGGSLSGDLQLRDRVRWYSPYMKCYVEGVIKAIGGKDGGVIIQWESGSGPVHSPCRESRYAEGWEAPDEARKQKRRDYLNAYRKRKRAETREACHQ
jgi:hypothetical protein